MSVKSVTFDIVNRQKATPVEQQSGNIPYGSPPGKTELTRAEIRVLALVASGTNRPNSLESATGIGRRHIYSILRSLEVKGLTRKGYCLRDARGTVWKVVA